MRRALLCSVLLVMLVPCGLIAQERWLKGKVLRIETQQEWVPV